MLFHYHWTVLAALFSVFNVLACTLKRKSERDVHEMRPIAPKRANVIRRHLQDSASSATSLGSIVFSQESEEEEKEALSAQSSSPSSSSLASVGIVKRPRGRPPKNPESDEPANPKLSLEYILGKADVSPDYKMIFQDGIPVMAFLEDDHDFFLDLPFLDSVLPSMAAGEQLFVPLYIQMILLPTWYGRRSMNITEYFHLEHQIIALARQALAPALSEYARLVYYAHLLSNDAFLEDYDDGLPDTVRLASFIEAFTGVDPRSFAISRLGLKAFLRENQASLASLIMIGLQWGFNVESIAVNILAILGVRHPFTGERFAMAVASGAVMPQVNPATVVSVHWAMHPVFDVVDLVESTADGPYYEIVPKVNYATRSGPSHALPRNLFTLEERIAKLSNIIVTLKQRVPT